MPVRYQSSHGEQACCRAHAPWSVNMPKQRIKGRRDQVLRFPPRLWCLWCRSVDASETRRLHIAGAVRAASIVCGSEAHQLARFAGDHGLNRSTSTIWRTSDKGHARYRLWKVTHARHGKRLFRPHGAHLGKSQRMYARDCESGRDMGSKNAHCSVLTSSSTAASMHTPFHP